MDALISPLILYVACAVGALGVVLALPKRGPSWRVPGALLAAIAGGLVIVLLGIKAADVGQLPNVYFYVFAALALGSALRVITHHRPVYSALYFILTIIASAGLYVLLAAEFMAFALVIIYAGAILITYLFVIMLATQAPTEDDDELQAEYDTRAREPALATGVGFVLLAVLTTMMFGGLEGLPAARDADRDQREALAGMPLKIERVLRDTERRDESGQIVRGEDGRPLMMLGEDETVARAEVGGRSIAQMSEAGVRVVDTEGHTRVIDPRDWPEELQATNVEMVGRNLLVDHPGTIEIAGVILLMAMLGATVLSRRQVEIDEAAKAREARRLGHMGGQTGDAS